MASGGDATAPLLAAVDLKAESTACGNDVKASLLAAVDLKEESMASGDDATVRLFDAVDLKAAKTFIIHSSMVGMQGQDRWISKQADKKASKQTGQQADR
jgi:hypothetical protein